MARTLLSPSTPLPATSAAASGMHLSHLSSPAPITSLASVCASSAPPSASVAQLLWHPAHAQLPSYRPGLVCCSQLPPTHLCTVISCVGSRPPLSIPSISLPSPHICLFSLFTLSPPLLPSFLISPLFFTPFHPSCSRLAPSLFFGTEPFARAFSPHGHTVGPIHFLYAPRSR